MWVWVINATVHPKRIYLWIKVCQVEIDVAAMVLENGSVGWALRCKDPKGSTCVCVCPRALHHPYLFVCLAMYHPCINASHLFMVRSPTCIGKNLGNHRHSCTIKLCKLPPPDRHSKQAATEEVSAPTSCGARWSLPQSTRPGDAGPATEDGHQPGRCSKCCL